MRHDQATAAHPRSRRDLMAVMTVVLLASIFPVELVPSEPRNVSGIDGQFSGKQGQILVVTVPVEGVPTEVVGTFMERTIPFFIRPGRDHQAHYTALLGLDMEDHPGRHTFTVDVKYPDTSRRRSYDILVMDEKFPVQHLRLPKDKVDLDEESLVRVRAEQEQVRAALSVLSSQRYWSGTFIEPVSGTVSGAFGRARIINGETKNPHNGEDISAPMGTDVVAMNDGVARLTVEHFFSGKGIFVDHGLGLYSMYFHLSEILVKDGEPVKRGQVIGKVGASGRASGPHLHLGVRLNGARVDPFALIHLPTQELIASTQSGG